MKNIDNYKELKEKWSNMMSVFLLLTNNETIEEKIELAAEDIWSNFILKEVIPMAEKRGREEIINKINKGRVSIYCDCGNPLSRYCETCSKLRES